MIYCLVYVSAATHSMSAEELETILTVSRKNNKKLDITGMLLYSRESFIQVVEGPKENIQNLYKKILNDERHTHIIKMLEFEVEERGFPKWSMGFKAISPNQASEIPGFTDYLNKDYDRLSDLAVNNPKAHKLLETFKKYNAA